MSKNTTNLNESNIKPPKYSPDQLKKLINNPNVLDVERASRIIFLPEFKLRAVKQFLSGDKTCREIFEEAGFDTSMFHLGYPNKQMRAWREAYNAKGDLAFTNSANNMVNYRIPYDASNPEDVKYTLHRLEKIIIAQQMELDEIKKQHNSKCPKGKKSSNST